MAQREKYEKIGNGKELGKDEIRSKCEREEK